MLELKKGDKVFVMMEVFDVHPNDNLYPYMMVPLGALPNEHAFMSFTKDGRYLKDGPVVVKKVFP